MNSKGIPKEMKEKKVRVSNLVNLAIVVWYA